MTAINPVGAIKEASSTQHWSHGKPDENYSPRARKQAFEKFMAHQGERAARKAVKEEEARERALSDSEKIERARKRREEMRLSRIAFEPGSLSEACSAHVLTACAPQASTGVAPITPGTIA